MKLDSAISNGPVCAIREEGRTATASAQADVDILKRKRVICKYIAMKN